MRYLFLSLSLFLALSSATAQNVKLTNAQDSASYAYGIVMAQSLKRQMNVDINPDVFASALGKTLKNDADLLFTQEQASVIYNDYNKKMTAIAGEKTRVDGEKFLAQNKLRKEVTTTASGLQYEVMQRGTGTVKPTATNTVKVHYHGTLIDGSVFDSSVERGQPATFGLNQVISGWTEGVQLMSAGDKFKFFLPYNLAYGERSAGAKIKPYSALVFEVELLEIVK